MKEIHLKNGFIVKVDDDDFERVSKYSWSVSQRYYTNYAITGSGHDNSFTCMHWVVMGRPDRGYEIDHADKDELNNQKSNLRFCTVSENRRNTGKRSHNTSGYKGVFHIKSRNKFKATISIDGKGVYLGQFNTAIEAARAYDVAAKAASGEFAGLNNV